ncbi:MAG: phage portal protein [Eubacteriaceae bacterium]|nr:phage portal protein [Eubacteriaceae bacterium]
MTKEQFYYQEIQQFLASRRRGMMIKSEAYFDGKHDILLQNRQALGEDGKLEDIENVPNNHVVDNQFECMVSQKTNYMFSKKITIKTENKKYQEALQPYFNNLFQLKLQKIGKEAILGGIDYVYPYYDDKGNLDFDIFMPFEIIPYWTDSMHINMDVAVRVFDVEAYEGETKKMVTKAEIFTNTGIKRFDVTEDAILPDMDQPISSYIVRKEDDETVTEYDWERFPIIPFKYNDREIPLLAKIKSLQDGINTMLSTFENNMEDDPRSCILILENYDGENLGEFRHNLSAYGAVKVRSVDGGKGGVTTLQITVNAENYKSILKLYKDALIENAHGFDSKDDRLSGSPNEMNIRSMYSDLDLDANGIETQFRASLEKLLWFIDQDLKNKGKGDFENEVVEFVFNRDIMANNAEDINNCKNSLDIVSKKTALAHHPYIADVDA